MTRIVVVLAAVIALALSPSAQGAYFISGGTAVSHARQHLHAVGYRRAQANCYPQGQPTGPVPGYVYHNWTCYFAAGDSYYTKPLCRGRLLISGSGHPGRYYFRVDYHEGSCPYGA